MEEKIHPLFQKLDKGSSRRHPTGIYSHERGACQRRTAKACGRSLMSHWTKKRPVKRGQLEKKTNLIRSCQRRMLGQRESHPKVERSLALVSIFEPLAFFRKKLRTIMSFKAILLSKPCCNLV